MRILNNTANMGAIIAAIVVVGSIAALAVQGRAADEQPLVVSAVAPVFPPVAVAANTSGNVVIAAEINAAGEVTSARAVDGHPLLRGVRAFEDTARRWRFIPAAGTRTVRLTFVLRIMPRETAGNELTPVFTPPYQVEVRHRPFEPVVNSDPPTYVRPARRRGKTP